MFAYAKLHEFMSMRPCTYWFCAFDMYKHARKQWHSERHRSYCRASCMSQTCQQPESKPRTWP